MQTALERLRNRKNSKPKGLAFFGMKEKGVKKEKRSGKKRGKSTMWRRRKTETSRNESARQSLTHRKAA